MTPSDQIAGPKVASAFRGLTHWGKPVLEDTQRALFGEMGDSFFHIQLTNACQKYCGTRGEACRLSDTLKQRWRKAGIIKYGDGKWYKVTS